MSRDDLIGKSIKGLTSIFRNDALFQLIKQAIDTQSYIEEVTDIGYNDGPLNGKSFFVALAPNGDTCTLAAHEATNLQNRMEDISFHLALFRDAIEQSALGYAITDDVGNIVYANPFYLNLLGYTLDEMTNVHFTQFVAPDGQKTACAPLKH